MRKLLKTKLCSRNLIKGMNTKAVSLVRYSGSFLRWTREELKNMDEKKNKEINYDIQRLILER